MNSRIKESNVKIGKMKKDSRIVDFKSKLSNNEDSMRKSALTNFNNSHVRITNSNVDGANNEDNWKSSKINKQVNFVSSIYADDGEDHENQIQMKDV